MRIIDQNSLSQTAATQTGRTGGVSSTGPSLRSGSGGNVSAGADSVELSGFSSRISEALRTDSASRAQRVAQLTAAVQSGTYRVDAGAISHALVNEGLAGGQL